MEDAGAVVVQGLILGSDGRVGFDHRLLLGVRILSVGAEDGDLLALFASLSWLGVRLQQVQGLPILLCTTDR